MTKSCLVTATPLNFEPVDDLPGRPNVDGQSVVNVTCSQPTAYTVALTPPEWQCGWRRRHAGLDRRQNGHGALPAIQKCRARHIWGNGSNAVPGAGSGIAQPLTVYGRVLDANVSVAPGDYQDTVTVSITY